MSFGASKFWMIFLLSFVSLDVLAGFRVNNGGGAWVCTKNGKVKWIRTNDISTDREDLLSVGNHWQEYKSYLKKIDKEFPLLAQLLAEHPVDLKEVIRIQDVDIEFIADMGLYQRPPKKDCEAGRINYTQVANYVVTGELVVDSKIWSHPEFSAIDKLALLLHERIYYAFRRQYQDKHSYRTSLVVSILLRNIEKKHQKKLIVDWMKLKSLDGKLIVPVSWFHVDLSCTFTGVKGRELVVEKWTPRKFGQHHQRMFLGFRVAIETSRVDGVPIYIAVEDSKSGLMMEWSDFIELKRYFITSKKVSVSVGFPGAHSITVECAHNQ